MTNEAKAIDDYVSAIRKSGYSIYDPIAIDSDLWIPTGVLERLLSNALVGLKLSGLPLRTRSKVVKEHVTAALGYPRQDRFRKCKPRFPGQDFDTYTQKANNLQVWNEEVAPNRRYVIIRISEDDIVSKIKVITGNELARLDNTGTLTQKYQARLVPGGRSCELITPEDTPQLSAVACLRSSVSDDIPTYIPAAATLMPIGMLFAKLSPLIGRRFPDRGRVQERNRGADLHRMVCEALGYSSYQDNGQFPDIRHQLLEVKLQTSPTIDLGLNSPDSSEPLEMPTLNGRVMRYCDVRYAIFGAVTDGSEVLLTNLYLTTGLSFFSRFPKFGGKTVNKKLQIPLPATFFL